VNTTTLSDRVRRCLDDVHAVADDGAQPELSDIRRRLEEPLRVLVTGRLSSGKSTLVNALLGRRIAPTGPTETTRIPAVFRYSDREGAEIVLRDGSRRPLALDGGMLPPDVGLPPESVEALQVRLSVRSGILDHITLIDSPGQDTLNMAVAQAAQELLGARRQETAWGGVADAVLFLLTDDLQAREVEVIRTFEQSRPDSTSAATTVGVLSKADTIGEGPPDSDAPLRRAERVADQHLKDCGGAVGQIFPVMGLLAESAETGVITDADVQLLGSVADAPADVLGIALISDKQFRTAELPLDGSARQRLLDRFDLFGIYELTSLLKTLPRAHRSARILRDHLRQLSGFEPLRDTLLNDFARRSDAIKARRAIDRLRNLAHEEGALTVSRRRGLLEHLGEMLREPQLHTLSVIEAQALVRSGQLNLPRTLAVDLDRMASGGTLPHRVGAPADDVAALREAVSDGAVRWSQFELTATPKQAAIARTMRTAYTIAFAELEAREPHAAEARL
jgi:energy-coupling factor transporter ATP-binding protein EcfA2